MIDANNNPGPDTITFHIGSGPQTIKPILRLPILTDPVIIDGTTQPGFSGTPIIELDGTSPAEGAGLDIEGGDSTVRGLVINRFHFAGIFLGIKGGNRVEGCYIGTDISGTLARPNFSGISINNSNNVIGGTTPAARNVVSGNDTVGIEASRFCCNGDQSPISGNLIQGNYVGVNATGNAAIPNLREGIVISSVNSNVSVTGNVVGGTQPGAGNVISGNHFTGLLLDGSQVRNNTVQGNFIGTDATGSFAIPNDSHGLAVTGSDNLIGGSAPGARNVISGNGCNGCGVSGGTGVGLGTGSGNIVKGNIIGANAALTAPIPNLEYGVAFGGSNNVVGGIAPGEGNVIAFNAYDGIADSSTSSANNSLRGNSIFSNGLFNVSSGASIGIDLGGSGVTPNDLGDADTGANNLQNFPVITSVTVGANSVNVKGTLNSTASTSFSLDFYANSVCDPLGYGEGARLVGSATVTSGAGGDASFDLNFPVTLPPGQVLTATATDPAGNTSEFSQCSATSSAVGSVSFNTAFTTVSEGAGTASILLNRTGGSTGLLTIGYTVVGKTATAGSDFTPAQGTLTFADGETSKAITLTILDDNVNEFFHETAKVTLSTSGDLDTLGSQSMMTLTIDDNDPQPGVTVGDISAAEGNSGTTAFNFPVTLSGPTFRAVTVNFNTTDGTASVGGNDYLVPVTNSVIIPAGQTSATITVQVNGDANVEADETFFVNLTDVINATLVDDQGVGTILNDDTPTIQLSSATYNVAEDGLRAIVTVNRSGDVSKPATVNYATSDPAGLQNCNIINGIASSRCDYTTAVGTLRFAIGETSKAISIPIVDDNFSEGNETFTLTLNTPTGASLGNISSTTVTITDNASTVGNPIDSVPFFVRQNYIDFLGREPDSFGNTGWQAMLNNCAAGDITCDRIEVSSRFFRSTEFQERGYYVYRFYSASLGRKPNYEEFIPDVAKVSGFLTDAEKEANKAAFAEEFVQRSDFKGRYDGQATPTAYVDALLMSTGLPDHPSRAGWIAGLNNGTLTRARVLRELAESQQLSDKYSVEAFVVMQYFGYLRRNPDKFYLDWIGILNQNPGDYRNMVNGFMNSTEYRARFAQ